MNTLKQPRAAVLQRMVKMLELGHDIDLVAKRGNGLSTMLKRLALELEEREWRVVRIKGVLSLRPHALAALHAAEIGVSADGRATGIAGVVHSLRSLAAVGPLALLVDDWHDLDEVSWGVIETVKARASISVVVGRRPTDIFMQTPTGLEGSSARSSFVVQLHPMGFSEMTHAVEERLGGTMDYASASRLFVYSGGVPALVFGVLEGLRLAGRVSNRSGAWELQPQLWHSSLSGVVASMLEGISEEDRDALMVLSVERSIELSAAEELVGVARLSRLAKAGFMAFYDIEGESWAGVSPPILVDYFFERRNEKHLRGVADINASLVSPGLGRTLNDDGIAFISHGENDATFLRVLGEQVERKIARRRALWEAEPTPLHAAALVKDLSKLPGTEPEIAEILGTDFAGPKEEFALAIVAYCKIRLDIAEGKTALNALEAATGAHSQLTEVGAQFVRLTASLECGGARQERDLHDESSDFAPLMQTRLMLSERFLGEVWYGHIAHARTLSEKISRVNAAESSNYAITSALLLCFEGDLIVAEEQARRSIDTAQARLDLDALHTAYYVLILVLTLRGRYQEIPVLFCGISALSSLRTYQAQSHADSLNLVALAFVRSGELEQAIAVAERARRVDFLSPDRPGLGQVLLETQLTIARGEAERGELLWNTAQSGWAEGRRVAAVLHGLAAIEISPDAERFEQLESWLIEVDSPLLHTQFDLAVAIREEDPHAIAAVAERLANNGEDGNALRAWRRAAEIAETAGNRELRDSLLARYEACRAALGPVAVDERRFSQNYLRLTSREAEIVSAVVSGLNNSEVAHKLGMSIRTVESHLNRILRKAEAEQRSDLAGFVPVLQGRRNGRRHLESDEEMPREEISIRA